MTAKIKMDSFDPLSSIKPAPTVFSATLLFSLLAVAGIVLMAYFLAQAMLPNRSSGKLRLIFIWHMFDALLHSTLEVGWLYHVFFSWAPLPTADNLGSVPYFPLPMTPPGVSFLGQPSRLYGSFYGSSPIASLWKEYANADRRAGGSDLTTVSMELLCVFVMGPLAFYVCYLLSQEKYAKAWFWMVFIASSELYGSKLVILRSALVKIWLLMYSSS